MLLSKALRMQQDFEDKKNDIIIEGLENKIKDYEASLEKKDFLLQATEGSLAELQLENARLNEELLKAQTTLKEKSERFEQERKELQVKSEAESDKNMKLQESLKDLRNKCSEFATRGVHRLKGIFSSVRASSKEIAPSAKDIPEAFEHIENEVNALDEVITGHGDFYALLASRGTPAEFLKAGCTHAKTINKPNFSLSPSDLVNIPGEARSIGNRFITQIWAKGGRELPGDEARNLLNSVRNLYLLFTLIFLYYHHIYLIPLCVCRMAAPKVSKPKRIPKVAGVKLLFMISCIELRISLHYFCKRL
jgi:predicted  nucleic acid-binding Zn-ribbon protein